MVNYAGVVILKMFYAQSHKFDTGGKLVSALQCGIKHVLLANLVHNSNFPQMPLKLQSSSRSHARLHVLHERPTCDVIDDERCSGSSERKIPRALAT